ncbi:MAG: VOC family protein [Anaerolineae bacterium]|nr:VOC family protein [Anaerolineae bacterium]
MRIEHIGICVPAPISMGDWYRDHLGFKILHSGGDDAEGVSFIVDSAGKTVLELGKLAEGPPLNPHSLSPLQLHIAIECQDPAAEAQRLVSVGGELIGESPRNAYQGEKILIRDPWGFVIQLLNRQSKLSDSQ